MASVCGLSRALSWEEREVLLAASPREVAEEEGGGRWERAAAADRACLRELVEGWQASSMKRLEELIYNIDPDAFTIMGSGFYVLGQGFSKRKVY